MRTGRIIAICIAAMACSFLIPLTLKAQSSTSEQQSASLVFKSNDFREIDTTDDMPGINPSTSMEGEATRNIIWGLDVLVSNDGFGLGLFYRREFTKDMSGFVSLSVSESKDEREVEFFDPFTGTSFVPGKLKRFMVLPLLFGVQYRLFRDDITDTFRPYVNGGAGPTMIFAAPFVEIHRPAPGVTRVDQIEFFKSLGKGQPHYTAGGYLGFGAHFGADQSNIFGVNFRYYFTYLFGEGLPSLYDVRNGQVSSTKKEFGGFFITLNVGMAL